MTDLDLDFSVVDNFNKNPTQTLDLPIIRIVPGELPRAGDEAEQILRESNAGIYVYGSILVTMIWEQTRVSGGKRELVPRNHIITAPNMLEHFARAAEFRKWSKQEKDWVTTNPPEQLATQFLARGQWNIPDILAIITAPTIRADGSILDTPGYDIQTGLYYDPNGTNFPSVSQYPTKADAEKALTILSKPLRLYNFVSPAAKSVAISGILTACVRQALKTAPLHAFDAPTAGSGKSNLVDYISVIATGHAAPVTTTSVDKANTELEKRLQASVLNGDTIISLDNMEGELSSVFLMQCLTQSKVNVRIYGKLENVKAPSIATFFATGNNLIVVGDMVRRSLVSRIDPQTDRPELKEFLFNPVDLARRARPILVNAALTIIRAYLSQTERVKVKPFASFEDYTRFVREPLVWLGQADPIDVLETTRASDPKLRHLEQLCTAWVEAFGMNKRLYAREVIKKAYERLPSEEHGEGYEYKYPDLLDALRAVATNLADKISGESLGWYLRRNLDRKITINYNNENITVQIFQSNKSTKGAQWSITDKLDDTLLSTDDEDLPF